MSNLFIIFIMAAGTVWMSLGIRIGTSLPAHAVVLANTQTKTYVTVPCILRNAVDQSYVSNVSAVIEGTEEVEYEPFVEASTKGQTEDAKMGPDRACANDNGFVHLDPWLWHVLGWTKARVAPDGTVLW